MSGQGTVATARTKGSTLVALVVALSVVALAAHVALWTSVVRTALAPKPAAYDATASGSTPTPGTAPGAPSSGTPAALHLDHRCLRSDNPPSTAKIPVGDPYGPLSDAAGDKAELQRLYRVSGTTLTPMDGAGAVRDCDAQLWDLVVATLPPQQRPQLEEFLVFDTDLSDPDGAVDGEVTPRGEDAGHWRLSIAPNGSRDVDVALIVAHEVGHLLSLGTDQLDRTKTEAACQTMSTPEGCLADGSRLLAFTDSRWDDATWDAWSTADDITDDAKRQDALDAFYDAHAKDFVTPYAATDPSEDFAETFAVWCALGPNSPLLPDVVDHGGHDGAAKLAWMSAPTQPLPAGTAQRCAALQTLTR